MDVVQIIKHSVSRLCDAGAQNVDDYERRLWQNAGTLQQIENYLSEASVALMFLSYGATVSMRDRPDLAVELSGEKFFAEVKHFKRKRQDNLNDDAEDTSCGDDELILLEDPTVLEGRTAYQQIADVAKKKAKEGQYLEGEINLLVIDSASETLDLQIKSGANEFSCEKRNAPESSPLHYLNGIMVMNSGVAMRGGPWNVEFALTRCPARKINFRLLRALAAIKLTGAQR